MAQKESQVQNFEKLFGYQSFYVNMYLHTFRCCSQNSTIVDTLYNGAMKVFFGAFVLIYLILQHVIMKEQEYNGSENTL